MPIDCHIPYNCYKSAICYRTKINKHRMKVYIEVVYFKLWKYLSKQKNSKSYLFKF